MPKLIPLPVVLDLLDDGPVVKLVIEHRKAKKGEVGCDQCIGRDRVSCSSLIAAAKVRGETDCTKSERSYYSLRALNSGEVRRCAPSF